MPTSTPEILAMTRACERPIAELRRETTDPSATQWLDLLSAAARAESGGEDDPVGLPVSAAWRRARLEAALVAAPLSDVLRDWYVLDASTGTLVHRHCLADWRETPGTRFCSRCAKVLFDNRGQSVPVERLLGPTDNPDCVSCWFGLSEAESYFGLVSTLWRSLLLGLDPLEPTVFRFADAVLRLDVKRDIWGSAFASVMVSPSGDKAPSQWAQDLGIPVVPDAALEEVAGGLCLTEERSDTLRAADRAVELAETELQRLLDDPTADPIAVIDAARGLAGLLQVAERHGQSIAVQRVNLERLVRHLGAHHPDTAYSHAMLARSLQIAGQPEEALRVARQVEERVAVRLDAEEPTARRLLAMRFAHLRLAQTFESAGDHATAALHWETCWRRSLDAVNEPNAQPFGELRWILAGWAQARLDAGDPEGALQALEEARPDCQRLFPDAPVDSTLAPWIEITRRAIDAP